MQINLKTHEFRNPKTKLDRAVDESQRTIGTSDGRRTLKKERIKAYEQSLQPMTVNELEVRLNKSAEEIKEGKVYTSEQLKSHFKKDE